MSFFSLPRRTTKQYASDNSTFTQSRDCRAWRRIHKASRLAFLWGCFFCVVFFVCVTEGWKAKPTQCSSLGVQPLSTKHQSAARGGPCTATASLLRCQGTLNRQRKRNVIELRHHSLDSDVRGGRLSRWQPTALASLESSDFDPGNDAPDCGESTEGDKEEIVQTSNHINEMSKDGKGSLRHNEAPPEDRHSKRQRQKQRHAQYLRRGRRFGSSLPPAPLHPVERKTINEKQTALEEVLDRMLQDTNVQVCIKQLPNCRLSVDANLSGEFTRQLWELTLTSLRASLRQSLHASALGVSEAFLLQKAGGPAAVRRDILRFTAEALTRKAQVMHSAPIRGKLEFEEDLEALANRLSPGSPLSLRLFGETHPKVTFKRPYKGLKLKVRKQPYAKGALFRATEDYLLFKHSKTVDYPDPQPLASEGDTLLLRVDQGWFEEPDGTLGSEIPGEYIKGQTTLHLVRPWLSDELLESMEGVAAGERRTIKVSIPFSTRHLLSICEQQNQNPPSDNSDHIESVSYVKEENTRAPGSSLVPAYLNSLANNTKKNVFAKLFGESPKDRNSSSNAQQKEELKSEVTHEKEEEEISADEKEKEPSEMDEDKMHYIDCFLEVECLTVKRRVPPEPNDDFFKEICGMTRAQLWDEIEASAESLVRQASSKYALGAAAAALDEITQAEIPESLVDQQAKATWSQQLKVRKLQGEDNSKIDGPEAFAKWKEENKRSVENILKTAYAIQAVCKKEGLEVNEEELQLELGKAMLQAPTESMEVLGKQLYKKAQARLVYDFIVKHADIEFFVDETPAQVSVEIDGERKAQQGVKAFPKGTNLEEWQRKHKEMKRERDALRDTASRFFVDAKSLRKYDKKNYL